MSAEKGGSQALHAELVERGLIGLLAAEPQRRLDDDYEGFLDALADAVSSSNSVSVDEGLDEALTPLEGTAFFSVQTVLVDLIPRLRIDHRPLMRLIERLVAKGGEDLAANRPNAALRDWCAKDRGRSAAICSDARNGDLLAVRHLAFALEGAADIDGALEFLKSQDADARRAAVTALGRIEAPADAARACQRAAAVARDDPDQQTALSALHAGFDILGRNPALCRQGMLAALEERLRSFTPEAVHAAAGLLWRHGAALAEGELKACLDAVSQVPAENLGTVHLIDQASFSLAKGDRLHRLADIVRHICDESNGAVRLRAFEGFLHCTREAGSEALGRVVIKWLLDAGPRLRSDLSSTLSDIGRTTPPFSVPADALPQDGATQLFLCRKSVGFLFATPLSAVAIPLAVLRYGDEAIAGEVLALVFDPLLLSYGGALREYVIREGNEGHPRAEDLRRVVAEKDLINEAAQGARDLVELQPSEAHRQIEHLRWTDGMRRSIQAAEATSIFSALATTQHLLYGRSSAFYAMGPHGEPRRVEVKMHEHSVSAELPLLNIIDPTGLAIALHQMKFEPRPAG